MKKMLVLAITPPPYGGHAIMVQKLIEMKLNGIKIYHIRMCFSGSMSTMGKPGFAKIIHMIELIWRAAFFRIRHNISVLYYVPGGANAVPVVRDICILSVLRILYGKTILHFHAAGVSEVIEKLPFVLKRLACYVYRSPDLNIYTSSCNPDYHYFTTKKGIVIHNGVEDDAHHHLPICHCVRPEVRLLFVGVVQESKGVKVLVEATKKLVEKGIPVRTDIIGEFSSDKFQREIMNFCVQHRLSEVVNFTGVKKGEEKWQYFLDADIFCFPTFFEAESSPLVTIEAMMFELPVVTTRWRGIPEIVQHEETGYLIPIRDVSATVAALETLIHNPELRTAMGKRGRELFLAHHHHQHFASSMEHALNDVLIA